MSQTAPVESITHYKEAEQSILGTMFVSSRVAEQVPTVVKDVDFYFPEHRKIFTAMTALIAQGSEINILSVLNELKKQNPGYNGTLHSLEEYLDYQASAEDVLTFAKQVAEISGVRDLKRFYEERLKEINNGTSLDLQDHTNALVEIERHVIDKGGSESALTGDALFDSLLELLDEEIVSYPIINIPEVDDRVDDFYKQELIVFAGRPGMGKTTGMLQSALRQLNERKVGFISMEMPAPRLLIRALAQRLSLDSREIRRYKSSAILSNPKYTDTLRTITDNMVIEGKGPWNFSRIRKMIYNMVYKHGVEVVYLDYIGLVESDPGARIENRQLELAGFSRTLKNIASQLNIVVVIASQLNRGVESRISKRPTLADLRESGAIEQDASVVLFFYPNYQKIELANDNKKMTEGELDDYLEATLEVPTIIEVGKQRNGSVFQTEVLFQKRFNRFISTKNINATSGDTPLDAEYDAMLDEENSRAVFDDSFDSDFDDLT